MTRFYNPVETHFGTGTIKQLSSIISSLDKSVQHILLLTRGGNIEQTDEYTVILNQLKDYQVHVLHLEIANPDVTDLYQTIQEAQTVPYDLIIAVGGGSILDVGKSVAALRGMNVSSVEVLRDMIVSRSYLSNSHVGRWIGMPTTAGTGSEVTPWATIWDKEFDQKYSIESKAIFAACAIIDPALTLSLPVRSSVVSGLDALCHATEAYWARNTNDISRLYALEAITCLATSLERIVDQPRSIKVRSQVARGSFLAGLAFSNTRTTACHSISYPITLLYGIEHGIAVSMTLGKMLGLNETAIADKERLFNAFGVTKSEEVDHFIANIYEKAGIARYLKDYGVPQDGLTAIMDKAYTKGRMDNNPVEITHGQLYHVLSSLYSE